MRLLDAPPAVLDLYRDLHRHAELSMQEHRTRARLMEALAGTSAEIHTRATTGLEVVMRNGDGPVVGFRADIDALPLVEETGLPYASAGPAMHACGHDVHAASLVGALLHLDARRQDWSGTLVAVFQPGEETGVGATAMIADGLFSVTGPPEVMLGQHVTSAPVGTILCRPGHFLSHQRSWRVRVIGVGGHAARPHLGRDPILAAAAMIVRLQGVVAREVDPFRMAVVSVGSIHGGAKENVIPAEVVFTISSRSYEPDVAEVLRSAVLRILRGEADASGVEIEVTELSDVPGCFNDPHENAQVAEALAGAFGDEAVRPPADPLPASDDFGQYARQLGIPSVIWNFGCQDPALFEGGLMPPRNHDARFAPHPRDAVSAGMTAAVAVLTARMTITLDTKSRAAATRDQRFAENET